MTKVSRSRESNRVSKLCIVMILIGVAAISTLALIMYLILGSLQTEDTEQDLPTNSHRDNQESKDSESNSTSDDQPSMTAILIIFPIMAIVLAIVILAICIIVQNKKKKLKQKQKHGQLLPGADANKFSEDIEQALCKKFKDVEERGEADEKKESDNDETCYKEPFLSQKELKRGSIKTKIVQFDECNENINHDTSINTNKSSQTFTKVNSFFKAESKIGEGNKQKGLNGSCKNKEDTIKRAQSYEIIKQKDKNINKCNECFRSETKIKSANALQEENQTSRNGTTMRFKNHHEMEDAGKKLVQRENENSIIPLSSITEKKDITIDEAKVLCVHNVKAACPSLRDEDNCTKVHLSRESEILTVENEIPQKTKASSQQDGHGTCNETKAEITQQQEEFFHGRLNWDQVFAFLARIMHPTDHIIFFIHLYASENDRSGISVHTIITHVDNDAKGLDTQSRLVCQFQKWKQVLGKEARIQHIKYALQEMGYKDTLDQLEEFMRNPPLFQQQTNNPTQLLELQPFEGKAPSRDVTVNTTHTLLGVFESHKNGTQTFVCHKRDTQRTSFPPVDSNISNSPPAKPLLTSKAKPRKRQRSETESSSEHETDCKPIKSRRLNKRHHRKLKRRTHSKTRNQNKCDRLVQVENINGNFVLDLIKTLLLKGHIINKASYHLFMRHTVRIIMKDTKKSEEEVLSLTCGDIAKCEKKVSNRGHVAYIIDFEHDYLMLHKEEWECLELYKGQREKVCQRILSERSDYVDSKYVFISFDGHALKEQSEEEKTKDEDYDQTESISSETTETSTEHSDEIYEKYLSSTNRKSKDNREGSFKSSCAISKEITECDDKTVEPETADTDFNGPKHILSKDETTRGNNNIRGTEWKLMDISLD